MRLGKGEGSESDRKAIAAAPSLPERAASDVTERRASGVFPRAGEVEKVLGTEPNTAGGDPARLGG